MTDQHPRPGEAWTSYRPEDAAEALAAHGRFLGSDIEKLSCGESNFLVSWTGPVVMCTNICAIIGGCSPGAKSRSDFTGLTRPRFNGNLHIREFSAAREGVAFPKNIRATLCSEDASNFHLPEGITLVTMHASFIGIQALGFELVAYL